MRTRSHWLLLALALSAPSVAHARRDTTFSYPFSRVWPTVVRLLRVDFECPITEKDKDEGYFFFEYKDHGKTFPGSVELVPSKENGVDTVRVVIQVPAMPSYVEAMMLDRLGRKLQENFGNPKGAPPPAPPDEPEKPGDSQPPQNPGDAPDKAAPSKPVKPEGGRSENAPSN